MSYLEDCFDFASEGCEGGKQRACPSAEIKPTMFRCCTRTTFTLFTTGHPHATDPAASKVYARVPIDALTLHDLPLGPENSARSHQPVVFVYCQPPPLQSYSSCRSVIANGAVRNLRTVLFCPEPERVQRSQLCKSAARHTGLANDMSTRYGRDNVDLSLHFLEEQGREERD